MLAVVAPGQGAQSAGFLTPWLALPGLAHRLDWCSAVVGTDLAWLGTAGSDDEIRDTAVCQPLLVAIGLVVAAELAESPAIVAGHSVGELTAAALSGALSAEAALVVARERGRAMAEAAAANPTGMSAVVGGDPDQVAAAIAQLGLTIANNNGAGQVVAAGSLDALASLPDALAGVARVIALRVAGAFHTEYMRSAHQRLETLAPAVPISDPRLPVLSNADGALISTGADLLARLVAQVAAPVRWDLCMESLAAAGVTAVLELPPAGTLAALIRRSLPDVEVVALRSPDDLPAAQRLVAEHSRRDVAAPLPWRIVVAPVAGVLEPASVGAQLDAGAAIGVVVGRRDRTPVVTPYGGSLVEWLVPAGDPVRPGQPLARMHPAGEDA
ncbi:MAG: acyltransferase domain-containing protein [Frankia sp.]|nr:acyltransferase domain-containing protein [Frankia sp.]